MSTWSWQRWTMAALVGVAAAVVIGVPTGIIRTSMYTRMTPVLWWNIPIWFLSAGLTGLVVATYVRSPSDEVKPVSGRVGVGGMLSLFAVGCPICNKLVVALIGVSGALNVWAPIQPVLGVASLALLLYALRLRVKAEKMCQVSRRQAIGS